MAHQKACGMDWKGLVSHCLSHLSEVAFQFRSTIRSNFMISGFQRPPTPKAFSSSPPSAMYISEPKMTMPRQRLNIST